MSNHGMVTTPYKGSVFYHPIPKRREKADNKISSPLDKYIKDEPLVLGDGAAGGLAIGWKDGEVEGVDMGAGVVGRGEG